MEYVVTAEILLRHKTELGSKYQIFRTPNERTNEPTNEPVSRSAKQLTNQPTNQPTNEPVSRSAKQPTNQPTNQGGKWTQVILLLYQIHNLQIFKHINYTAYIVHVHIKPIRKVTNTWQQQDLDHLVKPILQSRSL